MKRGGVDVAGTARDAFDPMRSKARERHYRTQLNASGVPEPVHAPAGQPAQFMHSPPSHCESPVHQHGTPAPPQVLLGDATSSQLPIEQDHAFAADWRSAQSATS